MKKGRFFVSFEFCAFHISKNGVFHKVTNQLILQLYIKSNNFLTKIFPLNCIYFAHNSGRVHHKPIYMLSSAFTNKSNALRFSPGQFTSHMTRFAALWGIVYCRSVEPHHMHWDWDVSAARKWRERIRERQASIYQYIITACANCGRQRRQQPRSRFMIWYGCMQSPSAGAERKSTILLGLRSLDRWQIFFLTSTTKYIDF